MNGNGGFGVFPVIYGGLIDSFNPSSLAVLIVFILFISRFFGQPKQMLAFGWALVGTLWILSSQITKGTFEKFLSLDIVFILTWFLHLFLGLAFVLMAGLHLLDWMSYKKSGTVEKFRIKFSVPKNKGGVVQPAKKWPIQFFLSAFFLGVAFAVFKAVWPERSYIYTIVFASTMLKQNALANFYLGLYHLMVCFPLLVALTYFYVTSFSDRWKDFFEKKIAIIKIISAAGILAVGCGLIYVSLGNSYLTAQCIF